MLADAGLPPEAVAARARADLPSTFTHPRRVRSNCRSARGIFPGAHPLIFPPAIGPRDAPARYRVARVAVTGAFGSVPRANSVDPSLTTQHDPGNHRTVSNQSVFHTPIRWSCFVIHVDFAEHFHLYFARSKLLRSYYL